MFRVPSMLHSCIIDDKPTKFSAESCTMLANFGEMVVRELEKEKTLELQQLQSQVLSHEKDNMLRAMNLIRCALRGGNVHNKCVGAGVYL